MLAPQSNPSSEAERVHLKNEGVPEFLAKAIDMHVDHSVFFLLLFLGGGGDLSKSILSHIRVELVSLVIRL